MPTHTLTIRRVSQGPARRKAVTKFNGTEAQDLRLPVQQHELGVHSARLPRGQGGSGMGHVRTHDGGTAAGAGEQDWTG